MISRNTITNIVQHLNRRLSQPTVLIIFRVAAIIAFGIHFALVGWNQLPDNPLQHQFKKELRNYVEPFFSQAWTLFSPNPINANMSMLMRFEYEANGVKDTTAWIDVTEPLIQTRKDQFWSPAQRISKFMQSCMTNISENHKVVSQHIETTDSLKADSVKAKDFYLMAMMNGYGFQSTLQYSVYVANNYFASEKISPQSVKTQYKILTAKFPRFSKRHLDYYDLRNYQFSELGSEFIEIINKKRGNG